MSINEPLNNIRILHQVAIVPTLLQKPYNFKSEQFINYNNTGKSGCIVNLNIIYFTNSNGTNDSQLLPEDPSY